MAGGRLAVAVELAKLRAARSMMCSRMHYSTVAGILERFKLPYDLIQDDRDPCGTPLRRGYRYRFKTRSWDGPATLYVEETRAGRQHRSMGEAMDDLDKALEAIMKGEHHE